MLEILKSGGVWIIPIIACAVIATFIIIERFIYYRTIEKNENPKSYESRNFSKDLESQIKNGN